MDGNFSENAMTLFSCIIANVSTSDFTSFNVPLKVLNDEPVEYLISMVQI